MTTTCHLSVQQTRTTEVTSAEAFARLLPNAFPAVSSSPKTWTTYARSFLAWFEYAGLVVREGSVWKLRPDGDGPIRHRLLGSRSALRTRPGVPQEAPRRSLELLRIVSKERNLKLPRNGSPDRDAIRSLAAIGAVGADADGNCTLQVPGLVVDGQIDKPTLLTLLGRVPGGKAGIDLLSQDPSAAPASVGRAIRDSIGARWTDSSTHSVGGHFRAWAKAAGVNVSPVPKKKAGTTKPE